MLYQVGYNQIAAATFGQLLSSWSSSRLRYTVVTANGLCGRGSGSESLFLRMFPHTQASVPQLWFAKEARMEKHRVTKLLDGR